MTVSIQKELKMQSEEVIEHLTFLASPLADAGTSNAVEIGVQEYSGTPAMSSGAHRDLGASRVEDSVYRIEPACIGRTCLRCAISRCPGVGGNRYLVVLPCLCISAGRPWCSAGGSGHASCC